MHRARKPCEDLLAERLRQSEIGLDRRERRLPSEAQSEIDRLIEIGGKILAQTLGPIEARGIGGKSEGAVAFSSRSTVEGDKSKAPVKGGPPANFEPVIITMKPDSRSCCNCAGWQRSWQASTTIAIRPRACLTSSRAVSRVTPPRPVLDELSTWSSTSRPAAKACATSVAASRSIASGSRG